MYLSTGLYPCQVICDVYRLLRQTSTSMWCLGPAVEKVKPSKSNRLRSSYTTSGLLEAHLVTFQPINNNFNINIIIRIDAGYCFSQNWIRCQDRF